MDRPIVVICGGAFLTDEAHTLLEQAGARVVRSTTGDLETLAEELAGADAVIPGLGAIPASVIERMERCRIISRLGVGYDNVDIAAARARGIPVTNVPDYCMAEVADHALALALTLGRWIPRLDSGVRRGEWLPDLTNGCPAFAASTFVIIGLGRIGRAAAHRARPFGFRVAACDPYVSDTVFAELGVERLSRDEAFAQADILSLHVPLTDETHHLVNASTLALMKPGSVLVNTARGAVIDTMALAEALNAGAPGGAGIDVFETEPLPADHPLRACANVVLTPHFAWHSAQSQRRLPYMAAEEVVRRLRGEPLRSCVNGVAT